MPGAEAVKALVQGSYDTHVHSYPDVIPRKYDDVVLVKRATQAGMAGVVLKSHYTPTAERAILLRLMFPGVQVLGSIVLNNSVGGINPVAVEVAARLGARVVWLPTVDSAHERSHITNPEDPRLGIVRAMQGRGIPDPGISLLDETGKVTQAMYHCLEVIAAHDLVLATGHISYPEMLAVAKAAKETKVQRVIITHPEMTTTYLELEQQQELAQYSVFFERVFLAPYLNRVAWETVYRNIRTLGPSSTILATDLGQPANPWADEGLGMMVGKLLEAGCSVGEIEEMAHRNPADVLRAAGAS